MERITRDNYREHPAINQSLLKALAKHPQNVLEEDKDWSDGLEFGDALDILLFTPEKFDEEYYVTNMDNLPSDNVKAIMELVVDGLEEGQKATDEDVLRAAAEVNYGQSWNEGTILRKVLVDGKGAEYGNILVESLGKRTLSIDRHMQITKAVDTLKNHEFTKRFISDPLPDHMERLVQVPLMAPCPSLPVWFKGLLDLIIIDHEKKIIYPWDLKSTGTNVLYFESQFMKFRYDLQAALYSYIIEIIVATCGEGDDPELYGFSFDPSGYQVANFGFIVIGSQDVNNPILYRCRDEELAAGLYGGTTTQGYEYKGAMQLAEELLWHRRTGKWDYPKDVYDAGGILEINVY